MAPSNAYLLSKVGTRRIQPPPRERPKVIMTDEAREVLRSERRRKADNFRSDLRSACTSVNQAIQTLAVDHHKSVQRVERDLHFGRMKFNSSKRKPNAWNAFCWSQGRKRRELQASGDVEPTGRDTLSEIVKENLSAYQALGADEKTQLTEDFSDFRVTKAVGLRVSAKSRLNDVNHTLKTIGAELTNLRDRTGVETILYATRGTTDLPLQGMAHATTGVSDFMASVMNIDNTDLISKMEGYAIQGIKGAAQNHAARVVHVRAAIREIITGKLREITGDETARMHWSGYFRHVVSRYQVDIEGWPETIPFANLSSACSGITQLEMLFRKWDMGITHWKRLSDAEFEALRQKRNEQLEQGEVEEPTRQTRSDKGRKRSRGSTNEGGRWRKKNKSAETIVDSGDETEGAPQGQHNSEGDATPISGATETPTLASDPTSQSAAANETAESGNVSGNMQGHRTDGANETASNGATGSNNGGSERDNAQTAGAGSELQGLDMANGTAMDELEWDLEDSINGFDGATAGLF